jgi:hypothetical protein
MRAPSLQEGSPLELPRASPWERREREEQQQLRSQGRSRERQECEVRSAHVAWCVGDVEGSGERSDWASVT